VYTKSTIIAILYSYIPIFLKATLIVLGDRAYRLKYLKSLKNSSLLYLL
jgi:hypothetical protein